MSYLILFLWIFISSRELSGANGELSYYRDEDLSPEQIDSCKSYNLCIKYLKYFSQTYFEIYTSLEEAETACRKAERAYLCLESSPKWCSLPSKKAELSPVVRGSYRLLKDFCGFESKSKPCCDLRNAYLEHSSCYKSIQGSLEDCNRMYQKSLSKILDITDELEQKKQRFCSVKWFGNCMKLTTQKHCGKAAAKVLKSYSMKAGKPANRFLIENENCQEEPYGARNFQETRNFCEEFRFDNCHPIHFVDRVELLEYSGTTDEDIFLSLCSALRWSLRCLHRAFKMCVFQVEDLGDIQKDEIEAQQCWMNEGVPQRYKSTVDCFLTNTVLEDLTKCQSDFDSKIDNITRTVPFTRHEEYFCGVFKYLQICWMITASKACGKEGKQVLGDIVELAIGDKLRYFQC